MDYVIMMLRVLLANWQDAITGGVILACSVIFIMGIAKMLGLGKIKNEHIKKAILYFSSIVMVFPTTAFYFIIEGISFNWYWCGCGFVALLTIVTYSLYENTGFRAIIHFIGEKSVGRWFGVLWLAFKNKQDNKFTVTQLAMTTADLKEEVKRDLHGHIKEDFDLNDL